MADFETRLITTPSQEHFGSLNYLAAFSFAYLKNTLRNKVKVKDVNYY